MRLTSVKMTVVVSLINALMVLTAYGQNFKTVVEFNGLNGGNPVASMTQGADGNYYSTTQYGGNYNCVVIIGCGTVVKVSSQGKLTTLYEFCSKPNCTDGIGPFGGLVLGTDGNLYGTTFQGGDVNSGAGTVFKITPAGRLTTLYSFCAQSYCPDGSGPRGALIQAADGNFYGTTSAGADYQYCTGGCGTVYRMTPSGVLTTIYVFTNFGDDGAYPISGVTQALDGNFYGTTSGGGNSGALCVNDNDDGCGTAFSLTPSGFKKTFYTFCGDGQFCIPDGAFPSGLLLASDGNFYGTTAIGGTVQGSGNIFKLTPQGQFTALYQFCSDPGCSDGSLPASGLIQGTDGALYGTTNEGGNSGCFSVGCGTVFKLGRDGTLTTVHTFEGTDGENPSAALAQMTRGYFLGTAYQGAGNGHCFFQGCGTVFAISTGLGPFVTFVQNSGNVGQTAEILGQEFDGTTSVKLNGVPASFTVVSGTLINFTVPAGATTGNVTVTTPSRTLKSNVPFHVLD